MPIINITLIEGRPAEKKAELIRELTDATERVLAAPRESIRVIINEIPPEHLGIAGVSKAEQVKGG